MTAGGPGTGRRTVRAVVRGRVQGVGFRAWTKGQAELHGLDGWVRNRRDGTVETVLAGAPEAVAAVLAALGEGPRGGRVDALEVSEAEEGGLEPRPAHSFAVLGTV